MSYVLQVVNDQNNSDSKLAVVLVVVVAHWNYCSIIFEGMLKPKRQHFCVKNCSLYFFSIFFLRASGDKYHEFCELGAKLLDNICMPKKVRQNSFHPTGQYVGTQGCS